MGQIWSANYIRRRSSKGSPGARHDDALGVLDQPGQRRRVAVERGEVEASTQPQWWSIIVVLLAFIGYQLYRIILSPTAGLIALTAFDAVIAVLTWREYGQQRHARATRAAHKAKTAVGHSAVRAGDEA